MIDRCDDHVSRTGGRISGFTPGEENLKNYLAALMKLRKAHPALWKGSRENLLAGETLYADLKEFEEDRLLYVLNVSPVANTAIIPRSAFKSIQLQDALSGKIISPSDINFSIPLDGLSARFLLLR